MFRETKNKVARILKIYAVINAIFVILASFVISGDYGELSFFVLGTALGICVNFAIFSVGEVIDLLSQIRDNTKITREANTETTIELPDL